MIYGQPQVITNDDNTDRIGIRTLVLSQMWQVEHELTSYDVATLGPDVPAVSKNLLLVGTQTRKVGGVMKTTWTYEGTGDDSKGVPFKDRKHSYDYGFDSSFAQVSIKLHPNYGNLLKNYEGYYDPESGDLIWPATLSGTGSSSNGLAGGKTAAKPNPMFGYQDYLRMEGEYRFRYAEATLPEDLITGAGEIAATLPGTPPKTVNGRNWLKAPPVWKRRGTVYDITETYWLSGPGGWPLPIYQATAANKVPGASASHQEWVGPEQQTGGL